MWAYVAHDAKANSERRLESVRDPNARVPLKFFMDQQVYLQVAILEGQPMLGFIASENFAALLDGSKRIGMRTSQILAECVNRALNGRRT